MGCDVIEPAPYPVIVVDDDGDLRALLAQQLRSAGYEVHVCESSDECLRRVMDVITGVVIADLDMPGTDGLKLCSALRELEAAGAIGHVYYLLLTSHSSSEEVVRGLDAGADDYLTKPYKLPELLARIRVGQRILSVHASLWRREREAQEANAHLCIAAQRLDRLANTDSLTGLANRRHLLERFGEAWATSLAQHKPIGCILIDLDGFKSINDSHGHEFGDTVLRRVGERIHALTRRPDLHGRLGGDEFVVVCPNCDVDQAAALAERLRTDVAGQTFRHGGREIRVTLSCGVAERSAEHASPTELLSVADQMAYAAKQAGRNQVCLMRPPGPERLRRIADAPAIADSGI